jgi:hypothetical protein
MSVYGTWFLSLHCTNLRKYRRNCGHAAPPPEGRNLAEMTHCGPYAGVARAPHHHRYAMSPCGCLSLSTGFAQSPRPTCRCFGNGSGADTCGNGGATRCTARGLEPIHTHARTADSLLARLIVAKLNQQFWRQRRHLHGRYIISGGNHNAPSLGRRRCVTHRACLSRQGGFERPCSDRRYRRSTRSYRVQRLQGLNRPLPFPVRAQSSDGMWFDMIEIC